MRSDREGKIPAYRLKFLDLLHKVRDSFDPGGNLPEDCAVWAEQHEHAISALVIHVSQVFDELDAALSAAPQAPEAEKESWLTRQAREVEKDVAELPTWLRTERGAAERMSASAARQVTADIDHVTERYAVVTQDNERLREALIAARAELWRTYADVAPRLQPLYDQIQAALDGAAARSPQREDWQPKDCE